ncbi:MAG: sodium:calcium antiporter [Candidatus Aenigmarchaeota archaeon]|nr:sodium:calcium antiporter [Candidatus Aenigmarchaeota archaeon]
MNNLFLILTSISGLAVGPILIYFTSKIILKNAEVLINKFLITIPIIGILILPLTTALPNLFVSIASVLKGVPEIVYLNNIGNNIANLTLIVAICALVSGKFVVTKSILIKRDSLFLLISTIISVLLMSDGILTRSDGMILVLVYSFYFLTMVREENISQRKKTNTNPIKNISLIILAGVVMYVSAELIVWSAKNIIFLTSLSSTFVGSVIVGLATVLPEASVMLLASYKKEINVSFSNLIGDSLASIPLVIGIMSILYPLKIGAKTINILLPFLLISTTVFLLIIYGDPLLLRFNVKKYDIKITEALLLIMIYILFMYFTF